MGNYTYLLSLNVCRTLCMYRESTRCSIMLMTSWSIYLRLQIPPFHRFCKFRPGGQPQVYIYQCLTHTRVPTHTPTHIHIVHQCTCTHTHTHHTQPCTGGKGDRTWTSWGKGFYPTPTRPSTTQHMCSECYTTHVCTQRVIKYLNLGWWQCEYIATLM